MISFNLRRVRGICLQTSSRFGELYLGLFDEQIVDRLGSVLVGKPCTKQFTQTNAICGEPIFGQLWWLLCGVKLIRNPRYGLILVWYWFDYGLILVWLWFDEEVEGGEHTSVNGPQRTKGRHCQCVWKEDCDQHDSKPAKSQSCGQYEPHHGASGDHWPTSTRRELWFPDKDLGSGDDDWLGVNGSTKSHRLRYRQH